MKKMKIFKLFTSVLTAGIIAVSSCPITMQSTAVDPVVVVSLGDSYSSGEGVEPFYGSDLELSEKAENIDWLAHRSKNSWPGKLEIPGVSGQLNNYKVDLTTGEGGDDTCKWYFAAVSGATTANMEGVQLVSVHKKELNDDTLFVRTLDPQFNVFNKINDTVDYVTITIGGNDVGFKSIIETCCYKSLIVSDDCEELNAKIKKIEDNIQEHKDNIRKVYEGIHERAPQAEIIVAGYPKLLGKTSGICFNQQEVDTVNEKVSWFNNQIEDLVTTLQQTGMPIHFVSVEEAFEGHGAYASDEWINRIYKKKKAEDVNENAPASAYSMHPNNKGTDAYAKCVNDKIIEIEREKNNACGKITGAVREAKNTSTPIKGATINIYKDNVIYTTLESNAVTGNFSATLPEGDYRIEVIYPKHVKFIAYQTVTRDQQIVLENYLLVKGKDSDNGTIKGKITDSVTGAGIPDALVYVRRGWDNPFTGEGGILKKVQTDSNGEYEMKIPVGNYTMYVHKPGYIETTKNIVCQKNQKTPQNAAMSPETAAGQIRIVLTWGVDPRDLDSHMVGKYDQNGVMQTYHVSYSGKSAWYNGVELCNLDVDDTSSYGPETITLNPTTDRAYYYYVHRYAGSGTVASSNAKVQIYQGQQLIKTFNVPSLQGSGDYWNVFAYKNGEIITQNTITSSPQLNYAE